MEGKVEQLLELYLEDRKRLLAILPSSPPNISPPSSAGNDNPPSSPPPPPPLAPSSGSQPHSRRKPRPILLGKQVKKKIPFLKQPKSPTFFFI